MIPTPSLSNPGLPKRSGPSRWQVLGWQLGGLLLILGLWWLVTDKLQVYPPYVFPGPTAVWTEISYGLWGTGPQDGKLLAAIGGSLRRVLTGIAAVTTSALACAGLLVPSANAGPASHPLINEVYGGGGNSGATLTHDFVELYNASGTAIDLTGWSVQYWSASGTSAQTTPLTGSVPAGHHFLVQEADGANTSAAALPNADVTGRIPMSSSAGRVALVNADGATVDLPAKLEPAQMSRGTPRER